MKDVGRSAITSARRVSGRLNRLYGLAKSDILSKFLSCRPGLVQAARLAQTLR